MVSLGDTAISLHILQVPLMRGGVFWKVKTQSAKICLNFNFRGGEVFWKVKTQSAKICLNFNCGGGGGFWNKFQFRGKLSNLVKNFWKPSKPPPLPKNGQSWATYPPPNGNLGRTSHFEFWVGEKVGQLTSLPQWKFGQDLAL